MTPARSSERTGAGREGGCLPKGGVLCDQGGAFVGAVPLLARTRRKGKDEWRSRDCGDLSQELSALYGLPLDISSKRGGLTAIAKALNEGDVARVQVATVLLGVPQPPFLSKGAPSRQERIKLAGDLSIRRRTPQSTHV